MPLATLRLCTVYTQCKTRAFLWLGRDHLLLLRAGHRAGIVGHVPHLHPPLGPEHRESAADAAQQGWEARSYRCGGGEQRRFCHKMDRRSQSPDAKAFSSDSGATDSKRLRKDPTWNFNRQQQGLQFYYKLL